MILSSVRLLEVELSPSKKICFICFDEKCFLFHLKSPFSFSRYLIFCLDFFFIQKKGLDQKDKFNFEFYDVITWLTNNYSTHIVQYLTKLSQPSNEIWLDNRLKQQKYFSSKIVHKMRQRGQFQTSFCFLKKLYMSKSKWSAAQFQYISIAFNLAYIKNKLYKTLDN